MCVCISIRKRRAACAWFKLGVWGVDDVREGEEEKDDDDDDDSMLSVCLSVGCDVGVDVHLDGQDGF